MNSAGFLCYLIIAWCVLLSIGWTLILGAVGLWHTRHDWANEQTARGIVGALAVLICFIVAHAVHTRGLLP